LLVHRAADLVEGPRSELARAIRSQPVPWRVFEGRLGAVVSRAAALVERIANMESMIEKTNVLLARFDTLEAQYRADLPQGWAQHTVERGMSRDAVDTVRSRDEIDAWTRRLDHAAHHLRERRDCIVQWVESDSRYGVPTAEGGNPLAALEDRYHLLLALGAIDRAPMQRRSAADLRRLVGRQLKDVAEQGPAAAIAIEMQVARQYVHAETQGGFTAEELWNYIEALSWGHGATPPSGS
jgi:hypothetical protein